MMGTCHATCIRPSRQRGVVAVEFALVSVILLLMLFGLIEMSRILFYWNSAAEATRLGARMAVVCDLNEAAIKTRMRGRLSILPAASISVIYEPSGCGVDSCQSATVSINGDVVVQTLIPFMPAPLRFNVPSFSTTLPRESMQSTVAGFPNPTCS